MLYRKDRDLSSYAILGPLDDTPADLKKPRGKAEKIKNEIYGFLLLLKFQYSLLNQGHPFKVYPINFIKIDYKLSRSKTLAPSNTFNDGLDIPLSVDFFKLLFGKITHLHNLKNIENSRHIYMANEDYTRITLVLDGPSLADIQELKSKLSVNKYC